MADSSNLDRVSMIVLRAMRLPLLSLFLVYVVGIVGFGLIPGRDGSGMSFLHALYVLSYTATTTGFGVASGVESRSGAGSFSAMSGRPCSNATTSSSTRASHSSIAFRGFTAFMPTTARRFFGLLRST